MVRQSFICVSTKNFDAEELFFRVGVGVVEDLLADDTKENPTIAKLLARGWRLMAPPVVETIKNSGERVIWWLEYLR